MKREVKKGEGLFQFAGKVSELMWLNLLTLLCCLPVITIGSALTAMHKVLVQIYRDEENRITATYFKAFVRSGKRPTILWLIYLAFYLILWIDHQAMRQLENPSLNYIKLFVPVLVFVGTLSLSWVFVLQSRYELTVKKTLGFAITRVIAFPVRSLLMGVSSLIPAAVAIYLPQFLMLSVLLGLSGPGMLQTCFYHKALLYMEETEDTKEEEDNMNEEVTTCEKQ